MKKTIYLVRHGTTLANLENRFAGRTGEPLHQQGRQEMLELGERLKGCAITRICGGPLPRTRESAKLLAELLDTKVIVDAALTEINIPHWDGLTKQEIRDRYGDQYPTWLARPQDFHLPGCETLSQVQQRAVAAVKGYLNDDCAGNVLVVSHLIVIRCLVLHFLGLPLKDFRGIEIGNGGVTMLKEDAERGVRVITGKKEHSRQQIC